MRDRHLFIIPRELYRATDRETVAHTVKCLRELGLYSLPYPEVTVRALCDDAVRFRDDDGKVTPKPPLGPEVTVDFTFRDEPGSMRIEINDARTRFHRDLTSEASRLDADLDDQRADICDFLVSLLATRNVVKTTTVNKLARLGIGKNRPSKRYTHTTTLSLPEPDMMESDGDHPPTGVVRAPHTRRGHIRRQHYGPGNQYVKSIWIEPCFVNCDPTFVSTRQAYNINIGA